MKTREEYLIGFEAKLVDTLGDKCQATNRHLIIAYSAMLLLVLFDWGSVRELTFLGAKLSVTSEGIHLVLPLVLSALYVMISYHLLQLAGIHKALVQNAGAIQAINKDARPIQIRDLRHFEVGLPGLIVASARWMTARLVETNPVRQITGIFKADSWTEANGKVQMFGLGVSLWIVAAVSLIIPISFFLLPLVLAFKFVYAEFFAGGWIFVGPQILLSPEGRPFLILCLLSAIGGVTLSAGIVMYMSYVMDLLVAMATGTVEAAKDASTAAIKLVTSTLGRLVVNSSAKFLDPF